ncbi:MAG TPA: N-acetylmuramoyl-L-alanine amidase [Firmicutes bacterium]|nr:N-acetylmuramoyl-L-alanine amidase [Candidatus Fermentithermobacillaceae bacterium]
MPLVCVDAGHGGSDPGAVGPGGELEKDVNLAVARYVRVYVSRCGYQVVLTRDSDVELKLDQRVTLANQAGAHAFISVHSNLAVKSGEGGYTQDPGPRGLETFYYHGSSKGKALAERLAGTVAVSSGFPIRRVAPSGFYVVKYTLMPAVLVETGFLSNETDRSLLREPAFLDKLALGIAWGIADYLKT